MNVTSASSALSEINRFVKAFDLDDALNTISSIEDLKKLLVDFDSPLSGSLIPLSRQRGPQRFLLTLVQLSWESDGERFSVLVGLLFYK